MRAGVHVLDEAERYPDRFVRTEVELWFRRSADRRTQASESFRAAVAAANGVVIQESIIEGIAYHGALIDVPAAEIPVLVATRSLSPLADDVMFFRPQPVLSAPV